MIRIEIDTDNAAFKGDDRRPEVARILRNLADHIQYGYVGLYHGHEQPLREINGNVIGSLEMI